MLRTIALAMACSAVLTTAAWADFSFEDNEGALTVLEDGKNVLVYHYGPVDPPEGIDARYRRACYIHPLYGLDGEVMTEDFPMYLIERHPHHRGVFWAWPKTTIGDKPADIWSCAGIYQHHEEWTAKEAGADKAIIGVRNFWSYADAPGTPVGREEVSYTIHPASEKGRAIDCYFKFTNTTDEVVTFLGATNKGYGGFNFRPDAKRKPLVITTADGLCEQDALEYKTPWADLVLGATDDAPVGGVAIFQHPSNPGYPHHGWILRHYGFLGTCWPHLDPYPVQPGKSFELRYRMYVHRGTAEEGKVAEEFKTYTDSVK